MNLLSAPGSPVASVPRPRNILFVHFSDLDMTGGERMTLRLIEGIRGSSYTPVLLTQRVGPLAEAVRKQGIETIILPLPPRLDKYDGEILRYSPARLILSGFDLLIYNVRFARILLGGAIAAVWCSNIRALLTLGITARLLTVPVVWNIWLAQFGKVMQRLHHLAYFLPNLIVTEYHGQAAGVFPWLKSASRKVSTVYTGLKPSAFPPTTQSTRPAGLRHVVSCCRITPRKNLECLLEAASLLSRRGQPVRVTIVGNPFSQADLQYFDRLKVQVDREGLASLVTFAGWCDDVRPYLESADLYVSSSLSEGLPGAVREAQAAGLPVVATDAGGTAEAVQDGVSGLLVPCGDAHALATAIETVVTDPELAARYGNAGRRRAAEMFSMEAFIRNYSSVFQRVLS